MASVTRKSRASRADRRKEITATLLEHIEQLLQHESWTDLSIERICAASGIPRSTFYIFFDDQGHLLTVLADEALTEITASGDAWWSLGRGAKREDLVGALTEIFKTYAKHGTILRAVIEAAGYDERVRDQLDALMERSFSAVTSHIQRAQREGWMDPSLDADGLGHWLSWMGESGLRAMLQRGDRPTARLVQTYVDIVWNILYRDQAP